MLSHISNLTYCEGLKKLHLIAHQLKLAHIMPLLYCSGKYRLELLADNDGSFTLLFEEWKPVAEASVKNIIKNLEMKRLASEYGMSVTVKGN